MLYAAAMGSYLSENAPKVIHLCAGRDVYGGGYRAVMGEMMTQGVSYSHVPARRVVWLTAMQPLFKVRLACQLQCGRASVHCEVSPCTCIQ